jgi:O-antigen ligase|tara:strand:+ start:19732 stop:21132 length:1401 start_codon:yes stop_codon:yes gene_type:complete
MAIDVSGFEITRASSGGNRRSQGQARLNHILAMGVIAFLFLAPIPLGANRPIFSAINAALIGGGGVAYGVLMLWRRENFRVALSDIPVLTGLWALLCLYAVVQFIVPVSTVFVAPGTQVVSSTLSIAPGSTLHSLIQFLTLAVFFFLVLQVSANRERARFIAAALFWVIVAHAIYGLLALTQFGDTLLFLEKWAYLGSATGTFVNRNSYATFMAFGLVLGTALAAQTVEKAANSRQIPIANIMFLLVGLSFLIIALYSTQSRMGLAAGLAGSVVVAIGFVIKLGRRQPRLSVLMVVLGVGLAIAMTVLFGSGTLDRLGSVEQSFDVRLALYSQVIEMIASRPLLGFGGGSFEAAFPLFHALPVSPDLVWNKTHSTYLALWVEYGVIFGSIPLLVVLGIGLRCIQLVIRRKSDWVLPLASLGIIVTAALHSLVDFSLEMEANALFFTALLALGLAGVTQYGRRQKRQ